MGRPRQDLYRVVLTRRAAPETDAFEAIASADSRFIWLHGDHGRERSTIHWDVRLRPWAALVVIVAAGSTAPNETPSTVEARTVSPRYVDIIDDDRSPARSRA